MTSRVGEKFARMTDRKGIVENQANGERLGEIRCDETKWGSPSDGSAS